MRTGLVVLNYNDAERTIKLVRRAAEMHVLNAICVTDNASTDDSVPAIRQAFSGVEQVFLIESPSNGGYAAGNNLGLRYLAEEQNCDILFIANPDVIFTKESIDEICHAFERFPVYGALGPVMRNADGTISSRPYLQIPGAWQGIGLCFYTYNRIYERLHPYVLRDDGNGIMEVDALQGSFWAVRRDTLIKAGYLDEGTFLFYEEMSFAMRIREKCPEYREGLLVNSFYLHNHSATIRSVLSQMQTYRIYMQSKVYFETTYHGMRGVQKALLRAAIAISTLEKRVLLYGTNQKADS